MSMRARSVGARRGRGRGEREDRRRWISGVINGHDYLAKLAPLCISLLQSPLLPLSHFASLSLFLSLPPPTSFHLLATSTRGLIIPTRAFSLYTCARLCLSYAWDPPTETMHPLFFLPREFAFSVSLSLSSSLVRSPLPLFVLLFFSFRPFFARQFHPQLRPVLVPPNSHYPKQFARAIAIGPIGSAIAMQTDAAHLAIITEAPSYRTVMEILARGAAFVWKNFHVQYVYETISVYVSGYIYPYRALSVTSCCTAITLQ